MTIVDVTKDNECCCSCTHNKRTFDKDNHCTCTCELDGHYIGYVANFESVCEEWERRPRMIDTIIAFVWGAWFGGCFGLVFAALIRGNDNDEEMFTE